MSTNQEHIDLAGIPLVDDHCHTILRDQNFDNLQAWRALFTESSDAATAERHLPTSLFYQRLISHLADFFGCPASEDAVLSARQGVDGADLIQRLLRAANFAVLVIDRGYPPPDLVLPDVELGRLGGCRIAPLLRLEVLMQELIAQYATLAELIEALTDALTDLRNQGYVGLKSIAAYRTGLHIERWETAEIQAAFDQARREVQAKGSVRLAHKPLSDTLLHAAFEQAARQELPVQFHTGYGDTDADMLLANPLHLRAILEDPAYRGMSVVLLHESYPYTRQGGYLAAVYANVYLDLSYGIPFLSYGEMLDFTREALGVAPTSKLLYASDAVRVPELFWVSALDGRRIIAQVLGEVVRHGDLSLGAAEAAAQAILHDNAMRLYGL